MLNPKEQARLDGLADLISGDNSYKTFCRASSFGWITSQDIKRCSGHGMVLEGTWQGNLYPEAWHIAKDHSFSCSASYRLAQAGQLHIPDTIKHIILDRLPEALFERYRDMDNKHFVLAALLVGHPANVHFVTNAYNSWKGARCGISLKQLYHRILDWNAGEPMPVIKPLMVKNQCKMRELTCQI